MGQIHALLPASYVTLGKSFHLTVPQFLLLYNGDGKNFHLVGLLWGLKSQSWQWLAHSLGSLSEWLLRLDCFNLPGPLTAKWGCWTRGPSQILRPNSPARILPRHILHSHPESPWLLPRYPTVCWGISICFLCLFCCVFYLVVYKYSTGLEAIGG